MVTLEELKEKDRWIPIGNWNKVKFQFIDYGQYHSLVTTLKIKEEEGDNSGYRKYYYINLSWPEMSINDEFIQNVIKVLERNNSLLELENDPEAYYRDIFEGNHPESI